MKYRKEQCTPTHARAIDGHLVQSSTSYPPNKRKKDRNKKNKNRKDKKVFVIVMEYAAGGELVDQVIRKQAT